MTTHKYRASGPDGRLRLAPPGRGKREASIEVTETTVVIPAYGRCPHLPALLCALLDAAESPGEIIVSHSGPDDPTDAVAAISDRITVLHHPERLLAGAARNRGAAIANGQWLAFIDADVRPRPDWLQTLLAAARRAPDRFAVGSVGSAGSGGYWGLCNWLSEFSEQAPWHDARAQIGGASCNMILQRNDFRAAGGFAEAYQPGEDTMLFSVSERWAGNNGSRRRRVSIISTSLGCAPLRHQYRLGVHSALVRQSVPLRGSLATRFWPLALVLWVPELGLITTRLMRGGPAWWLRGLAMSPGLLLGSWIWTAGFLARVLTRDTGT